MTANIEEVRFQTVASQYIYIKKNYWRLEFAKNIPYSGCPSRMQSDTHHRFCSIFQCGNRYNEYAVITSVCCGRQATNHAEDGRSF